MREAASGHEEPAAAPPPDDEAGNEDDKYTKLRELKQLLDDGILTQEEFDEEKSKILGS